MPRRGHAFAGCPPGMFTWASLGRACVVGGAWSLALQTRLLARVLDYHGAGHWPSRSLRLLPPLCTPDNRQFPPGTFQCLRCAPPGTSWSYEKNIAHPLPLLLNHGSQELAWLTVCSFFF